MAKFESRNLSWAISKDTKLETISNDQKFQDSDLSFGFNISSFEIVSDFDIRISNLGNKPEAIKILNPDKEVPWA